MGVYIFHPGYSSASADKFIYVKGQEGFYNYSEVPALFGKQGMVSATNEKC